MVAMVERRIFERLDADFKGKYSSIDAIDAQESGELQGSNLSAGGIMVNARNRIPEDNAIDLWLFRAHREHSIHTIGRIVWQREVSPGAWQAGLKLYRPDLMQLSSLVEFSTV